MSELVEALRLHAWDDCGEKSVPTHIANLAADRIEQLERELAEAVAAERERCAGIAERLAQQEAEDFNEQAWAEAIAAAIRTGEAEQ